MNDNDINHFLMCNDLPQVIDIQVITYMTIFKAAYSWEQEVNSEDLTGEASLTAC